MNQTGSNQYGSAIVQPGYGDVAKETALTKEAPLSGAPQAATAFQLPRRAQRQAVRGKRSQSPPPQMPVSFQQPQAGPATINYQEIARLPGASPLVQSIFGNA